ncbi:hypothetical protein THTE_0431 [Thermogutta terrifontis]|uniref:Uncharacterized protein n=1 Tax=Thermogutta terrifontis TaxID=1331910 RepID=A0A286RAQ2_9BACT|nr:hypothetical protein THTE_0431 [Thermogutta terrifontis]
MKGIHNAPRTGNFAKGRGTNHASKVVMERIRHFTHFILGDPAVHHVTCRCLFFAAGTGPRP